LIDAVYTATKMKKELTDIVAAYEQNIRTGTGMVLATVVHVEGSSYRRPGARMLVDETGKITGAISGGCLEGDALRKALMALHQQQNKLVSYNSMEEDDATFGIQLGCNGIVHILFEPIHPQDANNPVACLQQAIQERKEAVLVTLFSLQATHNQQPGTCYLLTKENTVSSALPTTLETVVAAKALQVLLTKTSLFADNINQQALSAFIEFVSPAVALHIIGAGNDAMPLVHMAKQLGWQVSVMDGRNHLVTQTRFPLADHLVVGKPEQIIHDISKDEWSVVVMMTHNYNYDLALLPLLLKHSLRYIGMLGPKRRMERLLNELVQQGCTITAAQQQHLYGPVGLDIGAETSEEIALSVLAEIKAVLSYRNGYSLRYRQEAIHPRSNSTTEATEHS